MGEIATCSPGLPVHERPGASADVVDVVSFRLDVGATELGALARLLSPAELARARRFRGNRPRDTVVVARGRLRQLLGLVLDCRPAAVELAVEPGGKPRLAGPVGDRLHFNVAHSGSLMLATLAIGRDVGIDVERVRADVEGADIAARFFALPERHALAHLAPAARQSAFFACWTRKEAVVKALGDGLTRPLDSFVVSVTPGRAEMLTCDPALGAPASWLLTPLPVDAGYHATLAVRGAGAGVSVRCWAWDQLAEGGPVGAPWLRGITWRPQHADDRANPVSDRVPRRLVRDLPGHLQQEGSLQDRQLLDAEIRELEIGDHLGHREEVREKLDGTEIEILRDDGPGERT
jgi:4'-phosphopantetheinyl transferase